VLSGATGRGLITFLAKDHILGGEPPDLNQQLASRAALIPAIEQTPIPGPAVGLARRRAYILLAPLFSSAFLAGASLSFAPVQSLIVCHLSLQAK
jgi:hypothetical protein